MDVPVGRFHGLRRDRRGVDDDARELFDAAKVSVIPSTLFVDAGDGHVRVTYGRRDTGLMIDAWEGWIVSRT